MTLQEEIKQAKQQLADLKAKVTSIKVDKLTVKIGDKGTLNVYGLGKFPVCLYLSQAQRLDALFASADFKQFLIENKEKLAVKEKTE